MSVFGVTNYLLVTQKGNTQIPFVRGTGFCVDFDVHSFYTKHVLTAAHVALPLKFPALFGRPPLFSRIGQRHLTPKALLFTQEGRRHAALPLEFNIHHLKGTSVAALRVRGERELFPQMRRDGVPVPAPFEIDADAGTATLGGGEPLVLKGLSLDRDSEGADVAEMRYTEIGATARLAYVSNMFGATVIVSTGRRQVSPGMSGSPVVRKSTGKCVGVLVAAVRTRPSAKRNPHYYKQEEKMEENDGGDELGVRGGAWAAQRGKRASIFNEERLPQRVSDDTAMHLAVKEFEQAHQNLEPPCLDLVGQDDTLDELGVGAAEGHEGDDDEEYFAAFVPIKEFLSQMRFCENV